MSVEQCRVTRAGVGSFIFYHPRLCHLEYEDSVGALAHLDTLGTLDNHYGQDLYLSPGCGPSDGYSFPVSHLTSEGEEGDIDDKLRTAASVVTRVSGVTLTRTR